MKPELIALFSNLDPVTIGLLIAIGVAMVALVTVSFWLMVIRRKRRVE